MRPLEIASLGFVCTRSWCEIRFELETKYSPAISPCHQSPQSLKPVNSPSNASFLAVFGSSPSKKAYRYEIFGCHFMSSWYATLRLYAVESRKLPLSSCTYSASNDSACRLGIGAV